jgi:hypothetical protein
VSTARSIQTGRTDPLLAPTASGVGQGYRGHPSTMMTATIASAATATVIQPRRRPVNVLGAVPSISVAVRASSDDFARSSAGCQWL